MKLYLFETCPYCVRVKIFAGLKNIELELRPIAPGHLPQALKNRVTQFSVPMLSDGETLLQESSEIIRYLGQKSAPLFSDYRVSDTLMQWQKTHRDTINALCYPRMLSLNPPEFATRSARDYFHANIPQRLGMPLSRALARTDEWVEKISAVIPELLPFLQPEKPSMDTIAAMAELHSVSMVAELTFPQDLARAFEVWRRRAGLPRHTRINQLGQ